MIEVVQAFDRAPITRLDSDDIAALERKIEAAKTVRRPPCLAENPSENGDSQEAG